MFRYEIDRIRLDWLTFLRDWSYVCRQRRVFCTHHKGAVKEEPAFVEICDVEKSAPHQRVRGENWKKEGKGSDKKNKFSNLREKTWCLRSRRFLRKKSRCNQQVQACPCKVTQSKLKLYLITWTLSSGALPRAKFRYGDSIALLWHKNYKGFWISKVLLEFVHSAKSCFSV